LVLAGAKVASLDRPFGQTVEIIRPDMPGKIQEPSIDGWKSAQHARPRPPRLPPPARPSSKPLFAARYRETKIDFPSALHAGDANTESSSRSVSCRGLLPSLAIT